MGTVCLQESETNHRQLLKIVRVGDRETVVSQAISVENRCMFFQHIIVTKSPQSSVGKILYKIYGHGRGWVFTPADFSALQEDPRSLGVALGRLVKQGVIRRLARGIYDYPKKHPKLGRLTPTPDRIAQALAANRKIRLQPTGAYAANMLRLSEQVPAKVAFLTDGPSRLVKVGNVELQFRKTSPRNLAASDRVSGTVIQALRYLGSKQITAERIETLRQVLPAKDRAQLVKDAGLAPAWMRPHLHAIAEERGGA